MPKKNKFQHKWIFDPELSKCEEIGIWCLTYVEGKSMLCGLGRMTNTLQPNNNSKVWNSEASTRFRTKAVRDHFKKSTDVKRMYDDAISTEKIRCETYVIKIEKKEENLSNLCNEKLMSALYWLCKEEVAHSKPNSLLELVESLGVEEVAHFKKRSSTALIEQLLILGSQVKENLLK